VTDQVPTQCPFRVGMGYDVHRFAEGRECILGGVSIPHPKGLLGHSDADVLTHAVMDALLGAAGLPDIGHFFPPSDDRWAGARSVELLRIVAEKVREAGYSIGNIDTSLVAERPKIAPHLAAMKKHLSEACGVEPHQIGIKATTNERLGFLGREEGIAALAVAMIFTSHTQ
jgi:2-C-methyl-D-erythritol 2,4-cyclodiphosphate synthase